MKSRKLSSKAEKFARFGVILACLACVLSLFLLSSEVYQETNELQLSTALNASSHLARKGSQALEQQLDNFREGLQKGDWRRIETQVTKHRMRKVSVDDWTKLASGDYVVLRKNDDAKWSLESVGSGKRQSTQARKWNLLSFSSLSSEFVFWMELSQEALYVATRVRNATYVLRLEPSVFSELLDLQEGEREDADSQLNTLLIAHPSTALRSTVDEKSYYPEILVASDPIRFPSQYLKKIDFRPVQATEGSYWIDSGKEKFVLGLQQVHGTNLSVLVHGSRLDFVEEVQLILSHIGLALALMIVACGLLVATLLVYRRIALNTQKDDFDSKLAKAESTNRSFQDTLAHLSSWNQLGFQPGSISLEPNSCVMAGSGNAGHFSGSLQVDISESWRGRVYLGKGDFSGAFLVLCLDAPLHLKNAIVLTLEAQLNAHLSFLRSVVNDESEEPSSEISSDLMLQALQTVKERAPASLHETLDSVKLFDFLLLSTDRRVLWQWGSTNWQVYQSGHWSFLEMSFSEPELTQSARREDLEQTRERQPNWGLTLLRFLSLSDESVGGSGPDPSAPQDSAPEERSACHPITLFLILFTLLLLSLLSREELGWAQDGSSVPPPSGFFRVEELHGRLYVRSSDRLTLKPLNTGTEIPEESEITLLPHRSRLSEWIENLTPFSAESSADNEVSVTLNHASIGRLTIPYVGQFRLNENVLASLTQGFRMTEREDIPTRMSPVEAKSRGNLERLFAFFIPERELPSKMPGTARDTEQTRFPIIVTYPEQTYLTRVNRLPVVINLEWKSHTDHQKPYQVFLWSEDSFTRFPIKESFSESTSIQVSRHGRFYWQVEDKNGRYASAPRTLLVRPNGEDPENRESLASSHSAQDDPFLEMTNIPINFPLANSIVYACLKGEDRTLPVRFFHKSRDVEEYEIQFQPKGRHKNVRIPAPPHRGVLLAEIPLVADGNLRFRIKGGKKIETEDAGEETLWVAASQNLRVHIQPACKIARRPDFLAKSLALQGGKQLPKTGGLVVLEGAL